MIGDSECSFGEKEWVRGASSCFPICSIIKQQEVIEVIAITDTTTSSKVDRDVILYNPIFTPTTPVQALVYPFFLIAATPEHSLPH